MNEEMQSYLSMIDDLRGQVRDLIDGLPAEALNWRPLGGGDDHATNSLAVLAAHVAGAEHFWAAEVIGGRPATRVRAEEFETEAQDSAELSRRLDAVAAETREVLSGLEESDLRGVRAANERSVPVRWAILHIIDHTALHLGHMQITYQLWMEGRDRPSPRWFERVPKN